MQRELESSKGEVYTLQVEMQAKGTAQESLENVQQEAQSLKSDKEQLLAKVIEMEEQQKVIYEANDSQVQELKE